ncbi:MAG: hypothetical protein DHS20C10_10980 [marine bacterium B5-7]|nr:MAG: hypothetical protein DHS20C10_10980 [marine bacterium B5-7]
MNKSYTIEIAPLILQPLFRASEARQHGIHPSRLSYYVKIHLIERIGRGVYRGVNAKVDTIFQWEDLVLIVNSVPNGVVGLVSALALYGLTDEIPRAHWIVIPHATTAPKRENANFVRMRDVATGKTKMKLGKETIQIFDRERTIVDAFRYLGKEIAIKALKSSLKFNDERKIDLQKLQRYAKKFKIDLSTYIFAITT